ncbi:MAG TPA: glycosyltransferase [Sphingobium sp.]|nr:glycosyltransferase [Sphingobium sp.]
MNIRNGVPHSPYPAVEHVTTSLDMGGAQTMLAKLVEICTLNPKAARPWIVSLRPPGVLAPRLAATGCDIYSLGVRRSIAGPSALIRLTRVTARKHPDLIQGWMYHGNLAASVAGMLAARPVPVVWNIRHSLADPASEKASTRALLKISAKLSRQTAAIIYNSRSAAREHAAFGFSSQRAVHIPNGFNCSVFSPDRGRRAHLQRLFGIDPGPLVVAMVARYHPMKDHLNLIKAVARARDEGHDLHLLLVGTGLDETGNPVAAAARRALPAGRLTISGERLDVAEWLPGVDMVALSSAWGEGFPNILGEAMACGIPCVTTDVGDSAWVIADAGMAVPPSNNAALATAIADLAAMPAESRRAIGSRGRLRVTEHFEIDSIVKTYRDLWTAVLDENYPPASVHADQALPLSEGRAG